MQRLGEHETAAVQRDLVLGDQAKSVADSPAFTEAFAKLERRYISEWRASSDAAIQALCWAKQRVLEDIANEFRAMIGNGDMAANTLRRLEQR